VGRPGEQLDRLIEDPGGLEAVRELPRGPGEGAEGRVDRAGPDCVEGRLGVEESRHRVRSRDERGGSRAGLIGSRLARPLVSRYGQHKVMLTTGALRACWLLGLAFVRPGAAGLLLVIVVQFGLVTCMGVFNPVSATYRLEHTATDRVARTLSAWSVSSSATIAAMTALWGLLASMTSPRTAIAVAGVLILATPLLLPRQDRTAGDERELMATGVRLDGQRRVVREELAVPGPRAISGDGGPPGARTPAWGGPPAGP
jgi:Major Facilitator Superfamily